MTLEQLNALSSEEATATFRTCCGSTLWADVMDALRPFSSRSQLIAEAKKTWALMSDDDRREAFRQHAVEGTAEYEARFGYPFVIDAVGLSANDVLALMRARLRNDAEKELKLAAREQGNIMQLRLERLFVV